MQLPGGSINPFLPGHLDSRRPKLRRYSGFPFAIASPFLEAPSRFFKADNRGLATSHRHPPHRISGGRTTLTVIDGTIHASLPETHSVIQEQQQGVIAFAVPRSVIDCRDNGASFFRLQINGRLADRSLVANGKNTTILTRPRHVVPEQMLYEAANGCEAAVPRNGRVAAPRFRMIQKRQYSIGLDVFKCQIRYRFASLIGQKQEKELERIAVSPYSVSAGSAHSLQVIMEEAFGQREE
jgi:hypothetical protein